MAQVGGKIRDNIDRTDTDTEKKKKQEKVFKQPMFILPLLFYSFSFFLLLHQIFNVHFKKKKKKFFIYI